MKNKNEKLKNNYHIGTIPFDVINRVYNKYFIGLFKNSTLIF